MAHTLKKGDTVTVIAGDDRGKQGVIERVFPKTERIIVSGVNAVKKHLKKSQKHPRGGIITMNASIHISNVSLVEAAAKPKRAAKKKEA